MKCQNCNNEAVGRSKYCSDKCKVAYNRNKTVTVTKQADVTVEPPLSSAEQGIEDMGFERSGQTMTPEGLRSKVPTNYGQEDCECRHCRNIRNAKLPLTLNHGKLKTADELGKNERNRIALPGDVDYVRVVFPPDIEKGDRA